MASRFSTLPQTRGYGVYQRLPPPSKSITFSPDGKTLAVGGFGVGYAGVLELWNVSTPAKWGSPTRSWGTRRQALLSATRSGPSTSPLASKQARLAIAKHSTRRLPGRSPEP